MEPVKRRKRPRVLLLFEAQNDGAIYTSSFLWCCHDAYDDSFTIMSRKQSVKPSRSLSLALALTPEPLGISSF